jgi:hypothetical protein
VVVVGNVQVGHAGKALVLQLEGAAPHAPKGPLQPAGSACSSGAGAEE